MEALTNTSFLHALGWSLINSVWQLALLWLVFQTINLFAGRLKPQIKYLLATLLLFFGFIWFCVEFLVRLTHVDIAGVGFTISEESGIRIVQDLIPFISVTYLIFLVVLVVRFFSNYRSVVKLRTQQLFKPTYEWRIFVATISERLGIQKTVKIWISNLVNSPVTVGFFKPVILIPVAMVNQLSLQQTEAVLLHELAHIKRNDYFINLLISVVETVLFFNPFVRMFTSMIRTERENICDDMVMQFQYEPAEYASALLILERNRNAAYSGMSMAATGNSFLLTARIKRLLSIPCRRSMRFRLNTMAACGVVVFFLLLYPFYYGTVTNRTSSRTETGQIFSEVQGVSLQDTNTGFENSGQDFRDYLVVSPPKPEESSAIPATGKVSSEKRVDTGLSSSDELVANEVHLQLYKTIPGPQAITFLPVTGNELVVDLDGIEVQFKAVPEEEYIRGQALILKRKALEGDENQEQLQFDVIVDSGTTVIRSIPHTQSLAYLNQAEEVIEHFDWYSIQKRLMEQNDSTEIDLRNIKIEIARQLLKKDLENKILSDTVRFRLAPFKTITVRARKVLKI
ncbi:MAG TPA: M56 family metallopeptidase [Parasegetibacter sp.]